MKIGILGIGEIGRAFCSLYEEKKIKHLKKDIKHYFNFKNIDVLDICIPYGENFILTVEKEIEICKPKLTIIHSTVPVGTTGKIKLPKNCFIVNSPVIGSHPFLKKSIKSFIKHVGYDNKKAAKLIKTHYKSLNLKCKLFKSFESTETAKLLCTSYYGLCIAWHDYINDVCKCNNIDFSVIKKWNKNYNKGYTKLKLTKYIRPILDAPINKKIGGHCVIPNAILLNSDYPSPLIKEILQFR